jgi:hypothetical protein
MDRLGAKIDVAADDPKIAHLKVVETMWTGRAKIKDDGSWTKDNARCVARGDLHSKYYAVTSNQTMTPVVRTPSLNAIGAVSALRRHHMTPFDVPGAYLQGKQYANEQIVCRAPADHRTYDERSIEVYWLVQNPLYGQSDAGAISGIAPGSTSLRPILTTAHTTVVLRSHACTLSASVILSKTAPTTPT